MVDSTTLVVLATLVQTVAITLTLLVFIFQFRSQEKAIKEAASQSLLGRYHEFILQMVGRPELVKLLLARAQGGQAGEPTPEEASVYGHLLVMYGIIEEAYLLRQRGWMDEQTWQQWADWLRHMSDVSQVRQIRESTAGTFDRGFEEFVSKLLAEK